MDTLVKGTEVMRLMGRFGVKERHLEGQMVVDFASSCGLVLPNGAGIEHWPLKSFCKLSKHGHCLSFVMVLNAVEKIV